MSDAKYPSFNDREFDLLKKLTNNTAIIAEGGGSGGLPDPTGHNGDFLTTDGTNFSWATIPGGGNVTAASTLTSNAIVVGGGGTAVSTVSTAAGFLTFAATPSSANLRALMTDESGTGALLFAGGNGGVFSVTSLNGNTFTAGTYTLTGAAGKVLTFSNTLTLAGTDGSTLNVGAGGTLGSNAFTSTAYAPLASPTFTGTVVIPTPFTLGAVSVTTTGTELNFVVGVTSAIQTQLNAKQATITFGTGVQTALGVNIGSAGAPVLFNGAGGTPTSMVGTNITGTAAGLTAGIASAVAVGGITGLGTGVATALAVNNGTAGAFQVNNASGAALTSLTAANISTGALANGMTATSQAVRDNSTKLATTAYADRAALVGNAASALTETSNATTIDWSLANNFTLTLNGNLNTVTFSNTTDGQIITVAILNTGSNFTVTWGNSIKWVGGTQPVQTIGAKTDVWTIMKLGSTYYGNVVQNFS